jgi:hypothetical protein
MINPNSTPQPSTIPVERLPGLPAHPIIRIYDDRRPIGVLQRNGKEIQIGMKLEGWWCEARGFGEAEFAVTYETQVPFIPITNPEQAQEAHDRFHAFVREIDSLFAPDIAMGRQFIIAEQSGKFIPGLLAFGEAAAKRASDAIDSYNTLHAETPDAMIAAMGVVEDPPAAEELPATDTTTPEAQTEE